MQAGSHTEAPHTAPPLTCLSLPTVRQKLPAAANCTTKTAMPDSKFGRYLTLTKKYYSRLSDVVWYSHNHSRLAYHVR